MTSVLFSLEIKAILTEEGVKAFSPVADRQLKMCCIWFVDGSLQAMDLGVGGSASSDRAQRMIHCKGRLLPLLIHNTYFESFISICCRISCLSSSVLLGKIFLSSSSCLLGLFRSFTASSSFLHFLGKVPGTCIERKVIRKAAPGDETGTCGGQEWHRVTVMCARSSWTH